MCGPAPAPGLRPGLASSAPSGRRTRANVRPEGAQDPSPGRSPGTRAGPTISQCKPRRGETSEPRAKPWVWGAPPPPNIRPEGAQDIGPHRTPPQGRPSPANVRPEGAQDPSPGRSPGTRAGPTVSQCKAPQGRNIRAQGEALGLGRPPQYQPRRGARRRPAPDAPAGAPLGVWGRGRTDGDASAAPPCFAPSGLFEKCGAPAPAPGLRPGLASRAPPGRRTPANGRPEGAEDSSPGRSPGTRAGPTISQCKPRRGARSQPRAKPWVSGHTTPSGRESSPEGFSPGPVSFPGRRRFSPPGRRWDTASGDTHSRQGA